MSFLSRFFTMLGQLLSSQGADAAPFHKLLKEHFGAEPRTLPVIAESFEVADHPNVHRAVEAFSNAAGRTREVHGVTKEHDFEGISMTDLLKSGGNFMGMGGVTSGPVTYTNVPLHDGATLACTRTALLLVKDGPDPVAILFYSGGHAFNRQLKLELMARTRERAEQALREIRRLTREHNVFRGHMVTLSLDRDSGLRVNFHPLPKVSREQVILPATVLERIERQTFGMTRHREVLLKTGRHLKRGMLLHGPPGTGKTYSAMYLISQMEERTILLLTGRGLGLIERACAMARMLAPSTVILEDVDLVAEDRRTHDQGCAPVLFELLNEMDGLRDDADVLFILTSNRPEALEPALAARPGRVDQAIEVPLPDEECRRRLMELYGRGLTLRVEDLDAVIQRTGGVSASFIKEMMRRAALLSADDGDGLSVSDDHIRRALRELLSDGGVLTRTLLGGGTGAAVTSTT